MRTKKHKKWVVEGCYDVWAVLRTLSPRFNHLQKVNRKIWKILIEIIGRALWDLVRLRRQSWQLFWLFFWARNIQKTYLIMRGKKPSILCKIEIEKINFCLIEIFIFLFIKERECVRECMRCAWTASFFLSLT